MRVLTFGDSITWGGNDPQGGWADRVKRTMLQRLIDHDNKWQLINMGIAGNTSADLLQRIDDEIEFRQRDGEPILIVSIGINDSRFIDDERREELPKAEFEINLREIVAVCHHYSKKVLLLGLTPVAEAEQAYKNYVYRNDRILEYDAVISQIAQETGVPKIELFDPMQAKGRKALSNDGLHPSETGHVLIAEIVQPEIDKLMSD